MVADIIVAFGVRRPVGVSVREEITMVSQFLSFSFNVIFLLFFHSHSIAFLAHVLKAIIIQPCALLSRSRMAIGISLPIYTPNTCAQRASECNMHRTCYVRMICSNVCSVYHLSKFIRFRYACGPIASYFYLAW